MTIREARLYSASERVFGGVQTMSAYEAMKYTKGRHPKSERAGRAGKETSRGPKKWLDLVDAQREMFRKQTGQEPPGELVAKWQAEADAKAAKAESLRRRQERKRQEQRR